MDLRKNERAQAQTLGVIIGLVTVAIGLLILAIVLTLGPVVGHNIDSSNVIPSTGAAGNTAVANAWNTNNTAILNGSEVWTQDTPLLGSAAIVVIASIIIATLLGAFLMRRS